MLTVKIAAIKSASDRFAKAAEICSYQKQDEIQGDIRETKSEVQLNRRAIEGSRRESAQNHENLGNVVKLEAKETRDDFGQKLAILESQNAELKSEITAKVDSILKSFLSSNERVNPKTGDRKLSRARLLWLKMIDINSTRASCPSEESFRTNCTTCKGTSRGSRCPRS